MIPTIDMEETGKNIKEMIEQSGITLEELRDSMGLTCVHTIYKWQKGKGMPTLDNLVIFAAVMNKRIDDILVLKDVKM